MDPIDRDHMSHPSVFQSQENWDKAQSRGTPNPDTLQRIAAYLRSRAPSCDDPNMPGQEIPTVLSVAFMSPENREILQQAIRRGVYQSSGNAIGRQSDVILFANMQAMYEAHARNINESLYTWEELQAYCTREIKRLNCLLCTMIVPSVVTSVQHYLKYIRSKAAPLPVLQAPTYAGMKDKTITASTMYQPALR